MTLNANSSPRHLKFMSKTYEWLRTSFNMCVFVLKNYNLTCLRYRIPACLETDVALWCIVYATCVLIAFIHYWMCIDESKILKETKWFTQVKLYHPVISLLQTTPLPSKSGHTPEEFTVNRYLFSTRINNTPPVDQHVPR